MNKVVNINLNGIVFSIDESAFELLKQYLDKLKIYFSATEGGEEIIQDIEARIAELLTLKKADRNAIIQQKDVDEVVKMMGDPTEIDAVENNQQQHSHSASDTITHLKRDTYHKKIGGVCSGLANYFGIDRVIPRILFLIAFFVFGSGLIVYILMWIVIPASAYTDVDATRFKNSKRLFRNPDDKRIGGVCSGIAEYLAIDTVWLRLGILAAFFMFGSGLLVYIILWIVLPEAKTAAEKLKMKGESIDVNNIEKQVRNALQKPAIASTQSIVSKAFRIIYIVFSKTIGAILLVLAVILIGLVLFLWNNSFSSILEMLDINSYYSYFQYGFGLFCFSVAALILLLGIKLIFHTRIKIKIVSIILTICILIGLFLMLSFGLQYRNSVATSNMVKELAYEQICPDTLYIKTENRLEENEELNDININKNTKGTEFKISKMGEWVRVFYNTKLSITPSKNENMQLYLFKTARGENAESALQNAEAIEYYTNLANNTLTVDGGIKVDKHKIFKYQQVSAKLKVPIGTIIKVDKNVMKMINDAYEEDFDLGETFKMTGKGLQCLDCLDTEKTTDEDVNIEWNVDDEDGEVNIKIKKSKPNLIEDSIDIKVSESTIELKKPSK